MDDPEYVSYKHIDELTSEDRPGRIRAEIAKSLWLQARLEQRKDK